MIRIIMRCFLKRIHHLVFVMWLQCVYWEVVTEYLNVLLMNSLLCGCAVALTVN